MKQISVFDVIGPNMIGPSSSHTAGALRIALLTRKIVNEPIKEVEFVLYGSFAQTYKGHGTDKALVAGLLGMSTEDERIKESFKYAAEENLKYVFKTNTEDKDKHPNTVKISVTTSKDEIVTLVGVSIGGGNIIINEINGMQVEFTGEYDTILVQQNDIKGIAAHITNCLSEYSINIAFMRIYRENKGTLAYTIIETDEKIDKRVVNKIKENVAILDVKIIEKR